LTVVIKAAVPGAKILDLAELGDNTIVEKLKTKYPKGKMEKGIAFPTCISVNHCVGHFSPLAGETAVLQEGDVVKM
jgi:methionine aminopeptidase